MEGFILEKILIADDDELLRELLRDILEREGYEVVEAEDGIRALDCWKNTPEFDLLILDIMMPGKDGLAVLRKVRESSRVPVIMLTALGTSEHELEGFRNGACDYITKPFHSEILLARVEASLRFKGGEEEKAGNFRVAGGIKIDTDSCTVWADGRKAELTCKEYQLLLYLMENHNIVLSRDQILERIWGGHL